MVLYLVVVFVAVVGSAVLTAYGASAGPHRPSGVVRRAPDRKSVPVVGGEVAAGCGVQVRTCRR